MAIYTTFITAVLNLQANSTPTHSDPNVYPHHYALEGIGVSTCDR